MKLIKIITLLLIFTCCKSQERFSSTTMASKELMISIFNEFNNVNDICIHPNSLYNISSSDYDNWNELVKNSKHILKMAITYNAKSEDDKIDFSNIFSEKDIEYMTYQAHRVKSDAWDKYLNLESKNKGTCDIQKKYYLTIPVFSLNNEYALIYQESKFGGTLVIYKQTNEHWKAIGNCLIWIN